MKRVALVAVGLSLVAGCGAASGAGGFDPSHPPAVAGPRLTCADVGRHVTVLSSTGPDQGADQLRCATPDGAVLITRSVTAGSRVVPPARLFATDCRGIAEAPVGSTAGITGPTCGSATFFEVYEGTSVVGFFMPPQRAVALAVALGL